MLRKKQGMMMKSEAGAEAIDLAATRGVEEFRSRAEEAEFRQWFHEGYSVS